MILENVGLSIYRINLCAYAGNVDVYADGDNETKLLTDKSPP